MTEPQEHLQEGASDNERLLFACKTDNVSLFQEITSKQSSSSSSSSYDINHQDGLGNTALHYACQNLSFNLLPDILDLETDVDLKNRLKGDTPLHLAAAIQNKEARSWFVNQLLEAGADPRERNNQGDQPIDLISGHDAEDEELRKALRKSAAEAGLANSDLVDEEADDDEDDGPPSDDE